VLRTTAGRVQVSPNAAGVSAHFISCSTNRNQPLLPRWILDLKFLARFLDCRIRVSSFNCQGTWLAMLARGRCSRLAKVGTRGSIAHSE
jgi:hypothetical protein